jgi:hypothetical protein
MTPLMIVTHLKKKVQSRCTISPSPLGSTLTAKQKLRKQSPSIVQEELAA